MSYLTQQGASELTRKVIEFGDSHHFETACIKCGKPIALWFNGGELDTSECCGYEYCLEHGTIEFVLYKNPEQ